MEDDKNTWFGEEGDYKNASGMMLPTSIKAYWIIDGEKYTYADFYVTAFDFDKPKKKER